MRGTPPRAFDRLSDWIDGWRATGHMILLLDFDGTLAPIVQRPELAEIPLATRAALERLMRCPGLYMAVVSGRGLADARERAKLDGIAYAGNHGMEIDGPGMHLIHAEAAAARPALVAVLDALAPLLAPIDGALIEDKGLTLSIHYRRVKREQVERVREAVRTEVGGQPGLHITEGKELLEVRPEVDWHKGRAVEFILAQLHPGSAVPVVYLGDDRTDEDAFRALRDWDGAGEGVIIADSLPSDSAAASYLRNPGEVGELLEMLAAGAPM